MSNKILIVNLDKKFKGFEKRIKKTLLEALKVLKKDNMMVEVYLIKGQQMRSLNKKFRGKMRSKGKTPSILSFEEPKDFIYPKSKFKKIGEIYLNVERDPKPQIHSNLQRKKIVDSDKFAVSHRYLLIHGLLHLLGYHHQRKNDRIRMEKRETLVIK